MKYILTLALLCAALSASETPPASPDLRETIKRSLPFLEKEGVGWLTQKKCVSCHHVSFMIWTHNEAQSRGFAIDTKKLGEWSDWAAGQSLSLRTWYKLTDKSATNLHEAGVPAEALAKLKDVFNKGFTTESEFLATLEKSLGKDDLAKHKSLFLAEATQPKKGNLNDGGGMDTVDQLLLGMPRKSEKTKEFLAGSPALKARWQETDGSWIAGGQLLAQNRPKEESNLCSTSWAALALASAELNPDEKKTLERANARLKDFKPGKSTESLVLKLLLDAKFGADKGKALAETLLKQQNPDGGWAWLPSGPSDAFTTGEALYALSYVGFSSKDAPIQRAQIYLAETQCINGSWSIASSAFDPPETKPERLKGREPIYRYWASAWAVLGLLRTLPPVN